jgi:CRISPR-associated protein Cas5d
MNAVEERSETIRLKVWGDTAYFARPDANHERVSYEVMTPSAARGILEAIFWKPAISWIISQIDVLKPVRYSQNGRGGGGGFEPDDGLGPSAWLHQQAAGYDGFHYGYYNPDHSYPQKRSRSRTNVSLLDVAYTIHARFHLTHRASPGDRVDKYMKVFKERARSGRFFQQPYLGSRDCPARFHLIEAGQAAPRPINETRELGAVFHDYDYAHGREALYFRARIENGRVEIPPVHSPEVRASGRNY